MFLGFCRLRERKGVGRLSVRNFERKMEGFATTKDFANGKDLISTQHLADTLGKSGVKIVDATWGLTKKNCYENDFLKQRIPGALFFDIDQISGTICLELTAR